MVRRILFFLICLGFGIFLLCIIPGLEAEVAMTSQPTEMMDCGTLEQASLGPARWITLTDFAPCREGSIFGEGSKNDGRVVYLPVYSTQENQEPRPEDIRVLLAFHAVATEAEMLDAIRDARIEGHVLASSRFKMYIHPKASKNLIELYPGIDPDICKIVRVGRGVNTSKNVTRTRWIAFAFLLSGIAGIAYTGSNWIRSRSQQEDDMTLLHEIRSRHDDRNDPF